MISKELVRQIISDQRNAILKKDLGIEREILEIIGNKLSIPHTNVITGIRRSGKSTLLRQIINKYYHDEDFYYLNFEDERFLGFKAAEFNVVYETLVELFGEKRTFFIDEIQHIADFDAFVRRFYDDGFKFFLTGSNAGLLKEEISTRLTGRHIDIFLAPFSFNEYLLFKTGTSKPFNINITEERAEIKRHFNEYFIRGGMPEYVRYDEKDILINIYHDIITKDIIIRKNINNPLYIKELYQYLIGSFAQRFSYNSLLAVSPINSVHSIKKYTEFLAESYFVRMINKYDHSLRKQMANDKKIYVADNGFIPLLSSRQGSDRGWLLENLVASSMDHSSSLFYYSGRRECDFLVLKMKQFDSAIQVCLELNRENYRRETEGLIEALDYTGLNEGLLLTYDQEEIINTDSHKIKVMPVWKWLYQGWVPQILL
ncbi:MAG: ATP-binding protein [Bacteroidales bacterium]|jgi:hypothetical protein|nr:ATP-binding protein [Bacteroidales bacterium]